MMNRSSERPTIGATNEAIRDDLPREVLTYAEGLRREMYAISRKYGVEKPADIGPKIASGEVSLADMDRMIELEKALRKAVAEKRIPFRMGAYREALRAIGEAIGDEEDVDRMVERLPMVPHDQLLSRTTFMQEVADAIGSVVPRDTRSQIGRIVTRIVTRAAETMSPEIRERMTQEIRADGMFAIGGRWIGGTLIVKGMDGGYLGCGMTGGTIRAEQAGDHAGESMRGGTLEILGGPAISFLGQLMEGGEIRAVKGENQVGAAMTGGTISVQTSGDFAGNGMKGGKIRIEWRAGDYLGNVMSGGRIEVAAAGMNLGRCMLGGSIDAASAESAGTQMAGGVIRVEVSSHVGVAMEDGRIEVTNSAHVGENMKGGVVVISGDVTEVGYQMFGGTIIVRGKAGIIPLAHPDAHGRQRSGGIIRYEGPWAWWKNLWIR